MSEQVATLKAEIARLREQLRPDMRDLFLFEAAEAGYKAELERLREFHAAATAPGVKFLIEHGPGCSGWRSDRQCICGGRDIEVRIQKAGAAIAEASEDVS